MSGQSERDETNMEGSQVKTHHARTAATATPNVTFYLKSAPVYKYQDPFEHFHFSAVAGRGGCATVYEVQHIASGEEYACKVVHTQGSKDRVQQALKEACMQIALSEHHNVATLKEVWVSGADHVFLFMEKCEGGEIFDAIVSRGALPEVEAARVMRVVLQLVSYCHERGMVHHDLKPENFMLKNKQEGLTRSNIRAIDFGAATFADDSSKVPSGTPQYAAPEIIMGLEHDHRADMWSAGVFLYCMLSGLAPFNGDDHHEQKLAVLHQEIDFEEDPWPFVSDEAKNLCQSLLQRKAGDRSTLEEALHHPWMRNLYIEDSELDGVLDRLQAFSYMKPTQQALLLEYAKTHGEDTSLHQPMFDLFDWMDLNGDGIISQADFKHGLRDVFGQLHDSFLEEVFQALAQSGENTVSWVEFLAAVITRQSAEDEPPSLCLESRLPSHNSSHPAFHLQQRDKQEDWKECWQWQEPTDSSPAADGDMGDLGHEQLKEMWQNGQLSLSQHSVMRGSSPSGGSLRGRSPVRGGSPTESSWDRMISVRGSSPATVGCSATSSGDRKQYHLQDGQSQKWDHHGASQMPSTNRALPQLDEQTTRSSDFDQQDSLDSSFENYIERVLQPGDGREENPNQSVAFTSGGVTYWYDEKQGEESAMNFVTDSDALYGAALAAYQARQQENA